MANKYVQFISDEHFLFCIGNLHNAYLKAKRGITEKKLYGNKLDIIKLTFDAKFNGLDEKQLIEAEISRQIDKSINNFIGTFHEQILGGMKGFQIGVASGFDIKATDDTLFADIKNKHNTMNSSSAESLFQKLATFANWYKKADCYWVQILAKRSFCEHWSGEINGKEYSHSRVFAISGDKFYALLSGEEDAFSQLYRALPIAIEDYLKSIKHSSILSPNSALNEIAEAANKSNRSILDEMTFGNFGYYVGFGKL